MNQKSEFRNQKSVHVRTGSSTGGEGIGPVPGRDCRPNEIDGGNDPAVAALRPSAAVRNPPSQGAGGEPAMIGPEPAGATGPTGPATLAVATLTGTAVASGTIALVTTGT
jgi:hypothetical protein